MGKEIENIVSSIGHVIMGKDEGIRLAVACLLANGHLLIEDLPGMGKTILSQALAMTLGLSHQRIQFTNDLLPADILGVSIFNRDKSEFEFKPGPIFSHVILADEINRATPKTQSALLEAMEERQVTIDGQTRKLPDPFFVIATQNPVSQMGTYPLPESQLDRFLMRIRLGYPDPLVERELVRGEDRREMLNNLKPVIEFDQLNGYKDQVNRVHMSDAVLDYVQRLVAYSRESGDFKYGLSPRAMLSLVASAKALALVLGRTHVIPEDVQLVLPAVSEHRLRGGVDVSGHEGVSCVRKMLQATEVIG